MPIIELKASRFQEWTKVKHPDLGEVEVGRWNPKFWSQNPPPELLEKWAEQQARFNLMLAASLPKVVMAEPKITLQGDEYTIEVQVENKGFIPTALHQAMLVKIVRPDVVALEFPRGMITAPTGRGGPGEAAEAPEMAAGREAGRGQAGQAPVQPPPQNPDDKVQVLVPENHRPTVTIDRLAGNEAKTATFKIRLNGITGTDCTVRYTSTRGGVIEKKIFIGKR